MPVTSSVTVRKGSFDISNRYTKRERVRGLIIGEFGIHRHDRDEVLWKITHLRTGDYFAVSANRAACVRVAQRLMRRAAIWRHGRFTEGRIYKRMSPWRKRARAAFLSAARHEKRHFPDIDWKWCAQQNKARRSAGV